MDPLKDLKAGASGEQKMGRGGNGGLKFFIVSLKKLLTYIK